MSHINVGPKYLDNSTGSRLPEGAKKATIQAEKPHRKAQRAMVQASLSGTRQVQITTGNTLSALSP